MRGTAGYEVQDDFAHALNCHCSDCRRATGATLRPLAGIEIDKIRVTKGIDQIMAYGDAARGDVHCRMAGLCSIRSENVPVRTLRPLVDPPSVRPTVHIVTASKAHWFVISDNL